jgi:thiol-disulfide isomerase/thioredoxin
MSRLSLICLSSALFIAGCDTAPDADTQSQTLGQTEEAAAPAASGKTPPPLPGQIVRIEAGTELPPVTLKDPDGKTLATADLKGTPVLLNLWATWCAPCKKEMPLLDALADELGEDVKVLTVSQDSAKNVDKVRAFFAEQKFRNLEQWLDPNSDLGVAFAGGRLLPTTILFDAEGKEIFRVAGDYAWDSEDAIAAVREAIAE